VAQRTAGIDYSSYAKFLATPHHGGARTALKSVQSPGRPCSCSFSIQSAESFAPIKFALDANGTSMVVCFRVMRRTVFLPAFVFLGLGVNVVDLASLKVTRTVAVSGNPTEIVLSPNGKLTCISGDTAMSTLNLSTWHIDRLANIGKYPDDLAYAP